MTTLQKPIYRSTRGQYRVLYQKEKRIIVGLEPGDLITFREVGRRTTWCLPADAAFRHAVRLHSVKE